MRRTDATGRATRYGLKKTSAFLKCRSGFAATEFALILPLLAVIFFGMLETSDILTINRRVALAVNTMVDLAAQSEELTYDDVDDLIDGVVSILEPNDVTDVNVNILSVVKVGSSAVVLWSRDESGSAPYTTGSFYNKFDDATIIRQNGSLLIVEMTYDYSPQFTHHFVGSTFTFERQAVRWPRRTSIIPLCNNSKLICIASLPS